MLACRSVAVFFLSVSVKALSMESVICYFEYAIFSASFAIHVRALTNFMPNKTLSIKMCSLKTNAVSMAKIHIWLFVGSEFVFFVFDGDVITFVDFRILVSAKSTWKYYIWNREENCTISKVDIRRLFRCVLTIFTYVSITISLLYTILQ